MGTMHQSLPNKSILNETKGINIINDFQNTHLVKEYALTIKIFNYNA